MQIKVRKSQIYFISFYTDNDLKLENNAPMEVEADADADGDDEYIDPNNIGTSIEISVVQETITM